MTRMLTARGAVQCKGFRVKKALKVADFKIMLEQELQIPVNLQRLWLWPSGRTTQSAPHAASCQVLASFIHSASRCAIICCG